ncbi:MAG: ferredoxin, partial [Syntrophomonadaceae bacterium]|nr:ferredoxin [Syntrophomonadaceae bacterium]
ACPGGCIGGGGQPITKANVKRIQRIKAIYEEDQAMAIRKSHDNPEVKVLYDEFLHEPLGHRSHELLHTHYHAKHKKAL